MGEVESLTEAGSRAAGVRVLVGQRMGASYTSDLSDEGKPDGGCGAGVAAITDDPYAGLPDVSELGRIEGIAIVLAICG
ncbi:MAG: DNA gyrase modulator [Bryobacteraceae bacterium]